MCFFFWQLKALDILATPLLFCKFHILHCIFVCYFFVIYLDFSKNSASAKYIYTRNLGIIHIFYLSQIKILINWPFNLFKFNIFIF